MEQELCSVIPRTHLVRQFTALSCGSLCPLFLQASPLAQPFWLRYFCPTKLNWFADFRQNHFEALASEKRENRKKPLMWDHFSLNPHINRNALPHLPQTWPDNFYSGIWSHLWHFRRICLGFMMLPQVKIWFIKGSWKRKLWSGYSASHNYGEKLLSKSSFFSGNTVCHQDNSW